jgi:hypothetical protein
VGIGRVIFPDEKRDSLRIDLTVEVRDPGICGDVGIVGEERERLRWDVAPARTDLAQHVAPVPPVEGRMGDQGPEAAPEDDRRHDEGDRHRGAE